MIEAKGPFSTAGRLLFLSVALHLVVIAVSGGGYFVEMLAGAVIWAAIAYGLMRGMRWLAFIAFLLAMGGGIVAMGYGMGTFGLTSIAFLAITAVDWLAAALLFVALWRPAETA